MTTLYVFLDLCLCIACYFCYISKTMILKGFLQNDLLFKSKICLIFVKKVFRARKISKDVESWVFTKAVIGTVE